MKKNDLPEKYKSKHNFEITTEPASNKKKHKIEITHSEKILFPESKITKGDLIKYYDKASNVILPFMKGRPLAMQRFPGGINQAGFLQKEVPDYYPGWIKRVKIEKKDGSLIEQLICDNKDTLIYMANLDCITPHIWLSKQENLYFPDKMVFDLDPQGSDDFDIVREAAFHLKEILEEFELNPFVMTTGSKGVHIVVCLAAKNDFVKVKDFVTKVSVKLVKKNPSCLTMEPLKEKRQGKVFVDTLRNAYAQMSVTPYSIRARENAPVATPIAWTELKDKNIHSQSFNIYNIPERVKKGIDPWKSFFKEKYSLPG
jgi:bifunctional non-homologous end joining protein LigD